MPPSPPPTLAHPEGLALLAYRGSIAHNMYIPGTDPNSIDDIDLIGIVIAGESCVLGLDEWGTRGTKELKNGPWDIVYYELRKAVRLLLQGNPNIMSLLWLRPADYLQIDPLIRPLLEQRDIFAGKHVWRSFAGYAQDQLQKMETRDPADLREYIAVTSELKHRGAHPDQKGEITPRPQHRDLTGEERNAAETSTDKLLQKLASYHRKGENIGYMGDRRKQLVLEHGYDAKNAAHCIRLLRMCREFLLTGTMTVWREADSAELLDIKCGRWKLAGVKALARELYSEIEDARDRSPLPEGPDREAANRVVIAIHRAALLR